MSDSVFVKHEYCPECGPVQDRSGNNLGVFSDGHKWCFACGHWEPGSGVVSLDDVRRLKQQQKGESEEDAASVRMPVDCSGIIPESALKWLKQYEITPDEVHRYRISWSPSYRRLIFPVFDGPGNVLLWQGRYFPDTHIHHMDIKKPRYHTRGSPDQIDSYFGHLEGKNSRVVVVEDFISAIKVARVCPSLCLWGSELSLRKLRRISLLYSVLFIWLDPDKHHHAARTAIKARPYFDQVSLISTNKDPKDYSTEDIKKWISQD